MRINFLPIDRKRLPDERRTVRPSCPGRRTRGTLIVDCSGCRHGQDLADDHCLRGIIRLMSSEAPGIREITLSRDWEIMYDQDCVDILAGIGDIARFANGISFQQPFEDCSSCPSNPRTVIARVVDALPLSSPDMDARFARPSGGHGLACEQCVRSLRTNLEHIKHMVKLAEIRANRSAFRVVSSDEH